MSKYTSAPLKLHVSCKVNIFIPLVIYYVTNLLKLQSCCNTWVRNKRDSGMGRVVVYRFWDFSFIPQTLLRPPIYQFLFLTLSWFSFTSIHDSQDSRRRGGGGAISLIPIYHFLLHRRLRH